MKSVIQILATVLTAVSCSFIQIPSSQIQSALNSTLLVESEKLFKPIYIPNIGKYSEDSQTSKTKVLEKQESNSKDRILKDSLQSEEIFRKSKVREDDSDEEGLKRIANHLKFSSKYSTNQKDSSKERISRSKEAEKPTEDERIIGNSSRITETRLERSKEAAISSKSNSIPLSEKHKTFSSRSDDLDHREEESEELTEIPLTTNEPKPTSFHKYSDEDYDNEKTTSAEIEKTDDLEKTEKEAKEDRSSIDDYYNSGSKNYHSIQTPLEEIRYRGRQSLKDDFEPETIRTRLVGGISRRPSGHNWPYSKSQIKEELEKLNEISDEDESYEKILDEGVKEEVKTGRKQLDLELAVEKDEFKFDRNKKYNKIDERNRRKQQQKGLSVEEAKDDELPLFQSLKQYQVNEKESNNQAKVSINEEGIWPTKSPHSGAPKNIFKVNTPSRRQPKNFNISNELKPSFQNHRFLGPIVFDHNLGQQTVKNRTKSFANTEKQPNTLSKGLVEKEKLDQDKLTNQRIQNSLFENVSKEILSFNHLEENEEMYNDILANIRSVFGVRIQPGKLGASSQKESVPEIKLDESKFFTWSLPLKKGEKNQLKEIKQLKNTFLTFSSRKTPNAMHKR